MKANSDLYKLFNCLNTKPTYQQAAIALKERYPLLTALHIATRSAHTVNPKQAFSTFVPKKKNPNAIYSTAVPMNIENVLKR